jgi:hypothetical protein
MGSARAGRGNYYRRQCSDRAASLIDVAQTATLPNKSGAWHRLISLIGAPAPAPSSVAFSLTCRLSAAPKRISDEGDSRSAWWGL